MNVKTLTAAIGALLLAGSLTACGTAPVQTQYERNQATSQSIAACVAKGTPEVQCLDAANIASTQ